MGCSTTPKDDPNAEVAKIPIVNGYDLNDYQWMCDTWDYSIMEWCEDVDHWLFLRIDSGCDGDCDKIELLVTDEDAIDSNGNYIYAPGSRFGLGPFNCGEWDDLSRQAEESWQKQPDDGI